MTGSLPFFVQVLDIAGLVPIILIDESHPRPVGAVGDASSVAGAGGRALLGACMVVVLGGSMNYRVRSGDIVEAIVDYHGLMM